MFDDVTEFVMDLGVLEPPAVRLVDASLADEAVEGAEVDHRSPDGDRFAVGPSAALLHLSGVASFLVRGGASVDMHVTDPSAAARARLLLNGSVLGLLLAQRGIYALHANAVDLGGATVLLAGEIGAGKSTTSAAFLATGVPVLADDISPLQIEDEAVVLRPTGRPLRLKQDAASALGIDVSGLKVEPVSKKALVPLHPSDRAVVTHVVVLVADPEAERVSSSRLTGLRALRQLEQHAYRGELLRPAYTAALFGWAADLAGRVAVWELRRPTGGWSAELVCEEIRALSLRPGPPA